MVTSIDPVIAYIYPEGLARFATEKYEQPTKENEDHLKMHLTNFAINSENKDIKHLDKIESKLALSELVDLLCKQQDRFQMRSAQIKQHIYSEINKTMQLTFMAVQKKIVQLAKQHDVLRLQQNFFGLYGADVIFDELLNAKLLEVNLQPSLGTSTDLDKKVKEPLVVDMFELAGIPADDGKTRKLKVLTPKETIIEQLEDEAVRMGRFQRLLPSADQSLLKYFGLETEANKWAFEWADKQ
jgi:tubulin polyglutamylase TTLL5